MNARRGLAAIALLVPLACTTKGSDYPYLPPTGGGGSGGITPMGNVTVEITTPADATVISDSTVLDVKATVVDDIGSDLIDTSSVKVVVTAGTTGSTAAVSMGQLVSAGGDTFEGTISLGNLSTGTYTLTVSAKSLSGVTAHDAVTLMVRGGPTLIVNAPAEGQPYSASVPIQILVDQGARAPTAMLAGNSVMLSSPTTSGAYDVYTATVWFGPPPTPPGAQAFQQLSGRQLLDVKESDGTATSEVLRTFIIDTAGPTIARTAPSPGEIVGGVVNISATVTDESGVLDSSVVAVIGDQQGNPIFTLQLQPQGSGVYSILFDAGNLTGCQPPPANSLCIVYPTISFRAVDLVGNQSVLGYDVSVDNIAPVADLDPPQLRGLRLGVAGYECSFAFDPLSVNRFVGDMPNDGCLVPQVFDLRARIEDDGNRALGLKVVPIAGIDPDQTNVYVWHVDTSDPNAPPPPLTVDTNGDGTCDAINPLLVPTSSPPTQSNQVLQIRLAGVPPAGSADFRPDSTLSASAPCGQGTATAPPKQLCATSQPTIALGYAVDNSPAIWSVEPIDPVARCLGNQFDALANKIPEGWACIAVATADKAGSKSVSAPIRVYIQYNGPTSFCARPPASAGSPPTCTGTFDPATNTAASGSCQARKFPSNEYYCAPGAC